MSLFLIIAAIDFGTTFSGLAFSFRSQCDTSPLKVNVHNWSAETGDFRAPSSVLFDPKKQFHSFGYEAEKMYEDLALEDFHQKWYLFRRFKMALYDAKTLKRDFHLYDIMGKEMSAKVVFAAAFSSLKRTLYKKMPTSIIPEIDIGWVITVPAIWTDAAKQFMREAAEIAGIPRKNLMIALEPEAASLFYMHLPINKSGGVKHKAFEKGSKYMVIDAGGGIVDIIVHEVMDDKNVKEIYKASGGAWGSTRIDDNFSNLLSDLVGRDCFQTFMKTETSDYLYMMSEFEKTKLTIKSDVLNTTQIQIPFSLNYTCRKAKRGMSSNYTIQQRQFENQLVKIGNRITLSFVLQLFKGTIDNITDHVQHLLLDPNVKGISTIVMVGGFSECELLQTQIRRTFPDRNIVFPDKMSLAVLKGAVMFGHNPKTIKERISRLTYGVQTTKFMSGKYNDHVFFKLVELGDSVKIDQLTDYVTDGLYEHIIYTSTERNTTYITDESCFKLGKIKYDVNELSHKNELVMVSMMFGQTEIQVKANSVRNENAVALLSTGKEIKASLNCLQ